MQVIATSKMRRAQERDILGRPYAEKMREVISHLASQAIEFRHPLLTEREVKRIMVVHFTSDRGLCGGFNANLNRHVASFILDDRHPTTIVAVGKKGGSFMRRSGIEVGAEFTGLADSVKVVDIRPISQIVISDYGNSVVDQVYLAYTRFFSTAVQHPTIYPLLPFKPEEKRAPEYIYEPNAAQVLSELLPRYIEMQIYHALLESIASEHSARMVAMKNATDNAHDLISDLTLAYNKARQEMITEELLDITGGAVALTSG
jgi:F-type H+-transporting ATPase subunit gamma